MYANIYSYNNPVIIYILLIFLLSSALKRDVTRMGKRTKRGAFDDGVNSLRRYYINNYQDVDKQVGIDALLGYIDGTSVRGVKSVNIFKQTQVETSVPAPSKVKAKVKKVAEPKSKGTLESNKETTPSSSIDKMKTIFTSSANTFKENVNKIKKQIGSQNLINGLFTNTSSMQSSIKVNVTAIDVELDDILLSLQQSISELFGQ